MRDTPITGGPALIIQHCAVWGEMLTEVREFTVRPPEPYAQHPISVLVLFKKPKRQNLSYFTVTPDHVRYVTIEQNGVTIYDSRAEVPCDMAEWSASRERFASR